MEFYNIRSLKIQITKVLYTPGGNRFRLGSDFVETSIQDCKYVLLLYSGRIRFIELGFNEPSVYKILRFIFKQKEINKIVLNIMEFFTSVRHN